MCLADSHFLYLCIIQYSTHARTISCRYTLFIVRAKPDVNKADLYMNETCVRDLNKNRTAHTFVQ